MIWHNLTYAARCHRCSCSLERGARVLLVDKTVLCPDHGRAHLADEALRVRKLRDAVAADMRTRERGE